MQFKPVLAMMDVAGNGFGSFVIGKTCIHDGYLVCQ
jgi:hypothetical protein